MLITNGSQHPIRLSTEECWKRRRTVPNCVNDSRRSPSLLRALPIHSVKCDGWSRKFSTVLKNLDFLSIIIFFWIQTNMLLKSLHCFMRFLLVVFKNTLKSSHIFSKSFVILSPWTVSEKQNFKILISLLQLINQRVNCE